MYPIRCLYAFADYCITSRGCGIVLFPCDSMALLLDVLGIVGVWTESLRAAPARTAGRYTPEANPVTQFLVAMHLCML